MLGDPDFLVQKMHALCSINSHEKNSGPKIGVSRCQILRLKCTQFDFRWGSASDPVGGVYSAPQTR